MQHSSGVDLTAALHEDEDASRITHPRLRDERMFSTHFHEKIRTMELRRSRLLDEFSRRATIAAVADALDYSPHRCRSRSPNTSAKPPARCCAE